MLIDDKEKLKQAFADLKVGDALILDTGSYNFPEMSEATVTHLTTQYVLAEWTNSHGHKVGPYKFHRKGGKYYHAGKATGGSYRIYPATLPEIVAKFEQAKKEREEKAQQHADRDHLSENMRTMLRPSIHNLGEYYILDGVLRGSRIVTVYKANEKGIRKSITKGMAFSNLGEALAFLAGYMADPTERLERIKILLNAPAND